MVTWERKAEHGCSPWKCHLHNIQNLPLLIHLHSSGQAIISLDCCCHCSPTGLLLSFCFFFFFFFFYFHTIARITLSTQSQTLSLLSSNSCKAPLHSEGKPESCVIYTALCTLALITYYIWQPHFLFLYFAWSSWSTLPCSLTWTHQVFS